ncbi:MAG: PEGA domain-containing protein, partial [Planctomycetes bacterium]|nr:PEGA domain-containing protein [Planctomycetota bacterium]
MKAITCLWTLLFFGTLLPALPAQEELPLPQPPDAGRWIEGGAQKATGLKAALLIGVGRHASEKSRFKGWELDCVARDLSLMKTALEQEAGFSQVTTLDDETATLNNIEGFFKYELPAKLEGEDNLLLIYYSGHGVVHDSERAWFTYFTDYEGERYSNLLTAAKLKEWIAQLKEKHRIEVCLVMDSCATSEKAPRRPPREISLGDERIYAAAKGEMTSGSVFTESFVTALKQLHDRDRVCLKEIFDLAHEDLRNKNLTLPMRAAEKDDSLVLIDRTGLGFTIRAVDSLTPGQAVEDAQVVLDQKNLGRTPCTISGLREGRYPFLVKKPGYLNTRVIIELDLDKAGGVYEVPLAPAYMVLEGRVQREDGAVPEAANVEVMGGLSGWRTGYHTPKAALFMDGSFRIIAPTWARTRSLEVTGLDKPHNVQVNIDDLSAQDLVLSGENRIPVYTLDPIVVSGRDALAESALKLDRMNRTFYQQAEALAASGKPLDCENAAYAFMGIRESVTDPATKAELENKIRA